MSPVGSAVSTGSTRVLGATLRLPAVWWGFAAVVALALTPFSPDNERPRLHLDDLPWVSAFSAAFAGSAKAVLVLGTAGLLAAWVRVRPAARAGQEPISYPLVTALWSLPLAVALPVLSNDAYLYLDQGWALLNGQNPYQVGLGDNGGPWSDLVAWQWEGTTAVYPPLALEFSALAVWLGQGSQYATLLALRIPVLLTYLVLWWCLPRLARLAGRREDTALWMGLANPIGLVNLVGGAHNDALMVGLVVLGVWLAGRARGRWRGLLLGAVAIGLAASVKQIGLAGFGIVALAGLGDWWRADQRASWVRLFTRLGAALAVAVASFLAVGALTGLGVGWTRAAGVPGSILTLAPASWLSALLGFLGVNHAQTIMSVLGLAIGAALLVWLTIRVGTRDPLRYGMWVFVVVAVTGASLWTWYLVPVFVLAGIAGLSRPGWRWAVGVVCAATGGQMVQEYLDFGAGGAVAIAALILLAWRLTPDFATESDHPAGGAGTLEDPVGSPAGAGSAAVRHRR